MSTVIVSTRVNEQASASLDALCARLERSRAWVLSKALALYVEEQTEFLDALHKGVDDLDNGRALNHDDVFRALTERRGRKRAA